MHYGRSLAAVATGLGRLENPRAINTRSVVMPRNLHGPVCLYCTSKIIVSHHRHSQPFCSATGHFISGPASEHQLHMGQSSQGGGTATGTLYSVTVLFLALSTHTAAILNSRVLLPNYAVISWLYNSPHPEGNDTFLVAMTNGWHHSVLYTC